ncbi:MAG: PA0069 family radical SAM protein [Geminicoccaceae bacterium]|nr:PA0069 family radical SAM protein [Geminicoccaceae bacterium]
MRAASFAFDGTFKGRGTASNPPGRFETRRREPVDDGWRSLADLLAEEGAPQTRVEADASRSAIVRNRSPDLPFDRSLNPYRGCEHGCVYCYARPTHNFLGLSSGLDFETRLFAKHDLAAILRRELARPGYRAAPLALGTATDPYQPVERRLRITRRVLEVLTEARHPVGIVTKSALVLRDLDLLQRMAADGLVRVAVSLTSLDPALARRLEPRAAAPHRRLETIALLAKAGVPSGVSVAPLIPGLTDHLIEPILTAARDRGATVATMTLLRLPHDVKDLFEDWLDLYFPLKKAHVLARIRDCRAGSLNDPRFGGRMTGEGPYAGLLRRRFEVACRRLGLNAARPPLRADLFRRPVVGEWATPDLFA